GRRRAARPPGGRRRRRAMPDRVKDRVADMMRWHRRTVIAVAALLVFALGRFFAPALPELRVVVGLGLLTALLATVCLGLITVGHVFLAGRGAFGTGAGLGYVLLAVVFFWMGPFIVPHMVRLDVKRLHEIDVDDPDLGPPNPFSL